MADASLLGTRSVSILARFNDYDEVQQWVVVLLYVQVRSASLKLVQVHSLPLS